MLFQRNELGRARARSWSHRVRFIGLALLVSTLYADRANAGDWPQILGPSRNGVAQGEKIATRFADSGPRVLWRRDAGQGYSGVAVSGDRAVLFHRVGNDEVVEAMNAANGKPLWKTNFPTKFQSQASSDHGPRCVPTIHGGKVFLYGAAGGLYCVSLESGRKLWSRQALKDYDAREGYFGAGSSPIVVGDRLLVNVGGYRAGAGIVAFDLETGKTLWKATDEQASYSSPVAATFAGRPQVVFITRYNTLGVNPANGAVLWKFAFGKRGPTVNAANPLVLGEHIFATSSYGVGAVLAKIDGGQARAEWSNDETLSAQFTTPVEKGGYLYGIDGREDVGVARLRCIDSKTGRVQWTQERFGNSLLILAGETLIIQTTDGEIVLAEANPKAYRELARAKVADAKAFALPALAAGRLYIRGPRELKCLDLRR